MAVEVKLGRKAEALATTEVFQRIKDDLGLTEQGGCSNSLTNQRDNIKPFRSIINQAQKIGRIKNACLLMNTDNRY